MKLSSPTEKSLFATKQNKQKRFYHLLLPTIPTILFGHTESQKDSRETLGHHSTATQARASDRSWKKSQILQDF